jgi:hypothetical protein
VQGSLVLEKPAERAELVSPLGNAVAIWDIYSPPNLLVRPISTPTQIDLVQKAMDIRERLIFRLDTVEGLRPSEWSELRVADAGDNRIHIRRRVYRFRRCTGI